MCLSFHQNRFRSRREIRVHAGTAFRHVSCRPGLRRTPPGSGQRFSGHPDGQCCQLNVGVVEFSRNLMSVQQRIAVLVDGRDVMGRQRINLPAVDFSQQMLISCHAAQLPVPVCSGLNTPLFPVQLEKTGIRGDDFCDHRSSCHATPAVRAAFMISQIYLVRVADAFHQVPFIIRALGSHLMPGRRQCGHIS